MQSYEELQDKLRPIEKMILAGHHRMALEKMRYMLAQNLFKPVEKWRVYQRIGDCCYELLRMEEAAAAYWQSVNCTDGLPLPIQQMVYSNYLLVSHNLANVTTVELAQRHFTYQQLTVNMPHYRHTKKKHAKIRLGYIADKFIRNVLTFFSLHLLTGYDRNKFSVHVYSVENFEDLITQKLRQEVFSYVNFPANTPATVIAARIYTDEIDILFDLGVHTLFGRTVQVLAHKPAPVQVAGIGYMSTSGIKEVDYFLTDGYLDPPGEHEAQFAEQLLRMKHSHWCYIPPGEFVAYNRKIDKPIVFGSFNKFGKITKKMLSLWLQIISSVPHSKLLLKCPERQINLLKVMEQKLKKAGFHTDQYELEIGTSDYMQRYNDVDIFLDTYPYVGGATTCDALMCGVPVITMYGERHGSRFGYSMLMNLGMGELAASSEREYVDKAIALARDRDKLNKLHEVLPTVMKNSSLMDYAGYVQDFEEKMQEIYDNWLSE